MEGDRDGSDSEFVAREHVGSVSANMPLELLRNHR